MVKQYPDPTLFFSIDFFQEYVQGLDVPASYPATNHHGLVSRKMFRVFFFGT